MGSSRSSASRTLCSSSLSKNFSGFLRTNDKQWLSWLSPLFPAGSQGRHAGVAKSSISASDHSDKGGNHFIFISRNHWIVYHHRLDGTGLMVMSHPIPILTKSQLDRTPPLVVQEVQALILTSNRSGIASQARRRASQGIVCQVKRRLSRGTRCPVKRVKQGIEHLWSGQREDLQALLIAWRALRPGWAVEFNNSVWLKSGTVIGFFPSGWRARGTFVGLF